MGSLPTVQVVQALRDEARESVSVSDLMAQLQSLQNQVAATHERAHELARPPGASLAHLVPGDTACPAPNVA